LLVNQTQACQTDVEILSRAWRHGITRLTVVNAMNTKQKK